MMLQILPGLQGTLLQTILNYFITANAPIILLIGGIMYLFADKIIGRIVKLLGLVLIILAVCNILGINVLQMVGL